MKVIILLRTISFIIVLSIGASFAELIMVEGTIIDDSGAAIEGAIVTLVKAKILDTTDANGYFRLSQDTTTNHVYYNINHQAPFFYNDIERFAGLGEHHIDIHLYSLSGRVIGTNTYLPNDGFKEPINRVYQLMSTNVCAGKVIRMIRYGSERLASPFVKLDSRNLLTGMESVGIGEKRTATAKSGAIADELFIKKNLYLRRRVPIESYSHTFSDPIKISQPAGSSEYEMRVIYPNGDEMFRIGDSILIEVDADPTKGWRTVVDWSPNAGIDWITIVEEHFEIPGSYTWTIPESLTTIVTENNIPKEKNISIVSSQCMIKCYEYEHYDIFDISDASFAVTE